MNLNIHIANRLKDVFLDGKWIANTNFKEQLMNTTWEQAIYKIENINSIALLTFHIHYYIKGFINVFENGILDIKDKYSFDMPEIKNELIWKKMVKEFINDAETLILYIEKMDEQMLYEPFILKEYGTYLRNIDAQIEHSYYHLGQIVLIKKIISEKILYENNSRA